MGAEIVSGELRPNLPAPCPPLLADLLVSCWGKAPAQRPTFFNIRKALEHLCNPQTEVLQDHSLHVDKFGVLGELSGGGELVALSFQKDEAGSAVSVLTEEHQSLATLEQRMAGVQVRQEFDRRDTPGSNLQSRYQDKHGENEEDKAQGSSSMKHRGGDGKTGGKRPRSWRESLEKKEDRRVLQRVSSFDTSAYHTLPSTELIYLLHRMGDNVGVVGIYGTGGIGKRTLAREVYDREQSSFGSRCFLEDVKGVHLMDLQVKMVTDLLHMDVTKLDWDFARWFEDIQKQKVLVVVDGIRNRQQFDALIPDLKKLAPGSRILITSRKSDILRNIMMDIREWVLYELP